MVEFTGTPTLTHHATNLPLPNNANIVVEAGDKAIFARRGSAGSAQWDLISYLRKSGLPLKYIPGQVIQTAYYESTAQTVCNASIPLDNTVPLITEGVEILKITGFQPKLANSKLLITVNAWGCGSSSNVNGAGSLFNGANCVGAKVIKAEQNGDDDWLLDMNILTDSIDTSARDITCRVGRVSGSFTLNIYSTATLVFGGVGKSTITVQEIAQ